MSPSLFVKPTFIKAYRYSPSIGQTEYYLQDGAWVQIYFPAQLRGSLFRMNLVSSHRPFYILPVAKLNDELESPLLNNGEIVQAGSFGITPSTRQKPNIRHNAAPSLPTEDEPLIWQTRVPLTKEAQNIEVQIWYPTETLATGEGDRGYRYQLELSEEGVKDQKDTRNSALDKSSLVVQQLGGRENAAVLPIHE